jgi:hypothetical protein
MKGNKTMKKTKTQDPNGFYERFGIEQPQDYSNDPIYQKGLEHGQDIGITIAESLHKEQLIALKTIIDAMLERR